MKHNKIVLASFWLAIGLLTTQKAYAGIHIGPQSSVGGVDVGVSHAFNIQTTSFMAQADSSADANIQRLGGNTFAVREWCGSTIRSSKNYGGWVQYNKSLARISGGLVWGPRCTNQKAGTAAKHDFYHNNQGWQPLFSPKESR